MATAGERNLTWTSEHVSAHRNRMVASMSPARSSFSEKSARSCDLPSFAFCVNLSTAARQKG